MSEEQVVMPDLKLATVDEMGQELARRFGTVAIFCGFDTDSKGKTWRRFTAGDPCAITGMLLQQALSVAGFYWSAGVDEFQKAQQKREQA